MGANVLVVEDETELASLYREWLSEEYRVTVAHSGREAIEVFDTTVDAVLLDRDLPDMRGYHVAKSLHDFSTSDSEDRGYLLALISALEPDWELLEVDYNAYLTKPVREDELLRLVEVLLSATEYTGRFEGGVAIV